METIKTKIKEIMSNYRNEISDLPDVSILNPEMQIEARENYLKKTKEKNLRKLEYVLSDVQREKNKLQDSINEKKFPKTTDITDQLQVELMKQNASQIAMSELDFSIVKFLKNELDKNNIDWINYFREYVALNSKLPNDLKIEMNKIFDEIDINTGVNNSEIEIKIYSALENKIDLYKTLIDENLPEHKMQLVYNESEISKLESELTPAIPLVT